MGLYTVSHETTTFISVDRASEIDDALEDHHLDFAACLSLTGDLRSENLVAFPIHSIVEAYATGENDDYSDGELKTFVRVSLLVEAESIEDAEDLVLVPGMLDAVYDRLQMPDSQDGLFEFTDAEEAELFTMPDADGQIAYLSHLETLKSEAAPKL